MGTPDEPREVAVLKALRGKLEDRQDWYRRIFRVKGGHTDGVLRGMAYAIALIDDAIIDEETLVAQED